MAAPGEPHHTRTTRSRLLTAAGVLLVLVLFAVAGWLVYTAIRPAAQSESAPVFKLEDPPSKLELQQMKTKKIADKRGGFDVDSVGLHMPLSEMTIPSSGVISPPSLYDAYLMRGHGMTTKKGTGTTIVALHSLHGGGIPGNKLIDVAGKKAAIGPGTEIQVLKKTFTVTKTETILKTETPTRDDVWKNKDGRLIVITCLQRTEGRSLKNVVIEAQRDTTVGTNDAPALSTGN